jgi:hypothetical protein
MTEIPFVKALGDAIERSAATQIAGRRRRIRRRLTGGALAFAVAASGVAAAAGVFESGTPEQLATTGIGCYDRADFHDANVAVLSTGTLTPIETCRRLLHLKGPLVACAGQAVLVFPGAKGTCERLGFKPLPRAYYVTRRRVNAFNRALQPLEGSTDCWEPHELARRVRALLERTRGWTGWTTKVVGRTDEGACGTVSQLNGDGRRGIDGAFDPAQRLVLVTRSPRRSTIDLLYAAGAPANRLMDASGERCYDAAGLEDLVRRELPAGGRALTFEDTAPSDGQSLDGPRGERLDEGCTVIVGFSPIHDDRGIEVELWH